MSIKEFKEYAHSHTLKSAIQAASKEGTARIVVCDTETTGITDDAKCTQVSLDVYSIDKSNIEDFCRADGTSRRPLVTGHYDFHVNPQRHIDKGASEVTGITDEMASKWKPFSAYKDTIQSVIDSADVIVGHNFGYDIKRLAYEGIKFDDDAIVSDTMFDYADCCKYRWGEDRPVKNLTAAARTFGYAFDAHNSSNDIEATAVLFANLLRIGEASSRTAKELVHDYDTHTRRVNAYLKGRETLRKRREAERAEKETKA